MHHVIISTSADTMLDHFDLFRLPMGISDIWRYFLYHLGEGGLTACYYDIGNTSLARRKDSHEQLSGPLGKPQKLWVVISL